MISISYLISPCLGFPEAGTFWFNKNGSRNKPKVQGLCDGPFLYYTNENVKSRPEKCEELQFRQNLNGASYLSENTTIAEILTVFVRTAGFANIQSERPKCKDLASFVMQVFPPLPHHRRGGRKKRA